MKAYERYVARVCRDLARTTRGKINAYPRKSFTGRVSKRRIVVDIACQTHLLGVPILIIIECKHYRRPVEVSDVEEFHSKLDDIGANKGIMFTTVGFQEGAKNVAQGRGIALMVLGLGAPREAVQIITKRTPTPRERAEVLHGVFFPWGQFADAIAGIRVDSADELFYALAFSMVDRLREMAGGRW